AEHFLYRREHQCSNRSYRPRSTSTNLNIRLTRGGRRSRRGRPRRLKQFTGVSERMGQANSSKRPRAAGCAAAAPGRRRAPGRVVGPEVRVEEKVSKKQQVRSTVVKTRSDGRFCEHFFNAG